MKRVMVWLDGDPVSVVRLFHARVDGALWHGRDPDAWMETFPEPEAAVLASVALDSPLGRRLEALEGQEAPAPLRLAVTDGPQFRFDACLAVGPSDDGGITVPVQFINAGPVTRDEVPA